MSDGSPTATSVMEPQGSSGVPSPPTTSTGSQPPPARGVPAWLVIVLVLLAALIAGGGVYLLTRGSATPSGTGTAIATSTVPATAPVEASATPTGSVPATPSVAPIRRAPLKVREAAIIKKVTGSAGTGYYVTVDYVQWLTGKAAAAAAKAHGDESPPPNDYYIVNDSAKLRTFLLPPSAVISVLGWKGDGSDTLKQKVITPAQLRSVLTGGSHPRPEYVDGTFWLTVVDDARVTRIVQQFRP